MKYLISVAVAPVAPRRGRPPGRRNPRPPQVLEADVENENIPAQMPFAQIVAIDIHNQPRPGSPQALEEDVENEIPPAPRPNSPIIANVIPGQLRPGSPHVHEAIAANDILPAPVIPNAGPAPILQRANGGNVIVASINVFTCMKIIY